MLIILSPLAFYNTQSVAGLLINPFSTKNFLLSFFEQPGNALFGPNYTPPKPGTYLWEEAPTRTVPLVVSWAVDIWYVQVR